MNRYACFLLLLLSFAAQAQKQGDIWYFGKQCGLDFTTGSPVFVSGGQTGTDVPYWDVQEGTSSIADSAGRLLFYTGGKTIWNLNHQAMPNGTGLFGGTSSTQSSLIVPKPGSDSLFYVFTTDEFQSYWSPLVPRGYRYNVVNMCLYSSRGDVVAGQKNILLTDSSTEKLCACEDAAGTGYWIMGHKMYSNKFVAWHLTSAGFTNTVVSALGYVHGSNNSPGSAQGQMKFSPNGTKLAMVVGNAYPGIVELYDFNSSTGVVSNNCRLPVDSFQSGVYGVEFSPDNSKLYLALNAGLWMGPHINQFDLNAGSKTCSDIKASLDTCFKDPRGTSTPYNMNGMQLGPDGKIYIVTSNFMIGRINYPNLSGSAIGFEPDTIGFGGNFNKYTFPAFIAGYKYHNRTIPCKVSAGVNISASANGICSGIRVTFTATPVNGGTAPAYQWKVNANNVGNGSASYSYVPTNGDTVMCLLWSNAANAANPNCLSNRIVMGVAPLVVPGINVNTIAPVVGCEGAPILFVTNIVGGGANPRYQWYKNGIALPGATNSTVMDTAPKNGDTLRASLVNSLSCPSTPVAWSNHVGLVLKPAVVPSISVSPAGPVPAEMQMSFTAMASDTGTKPRYQWKKNGTDIAFATGLSYTSGALVNGDVISVSLLSDNPCAIPALASSNEVHIVAGLGMSSNNGGWFTMLYPNPNKGSFIVSLSQGSNAVGKWYTVDVINNLGQALYHAEVPTQTGRASQTIVLPGGCPEGSYYIRVRSEKGGAATLRFLLQR